MWENCDQELMASSSNQMMLEEEEPAICRCSNRRPNLRFVETRGIHVGDQYVSVNQTVHTREVLRGRFLGLELVSVKSSRQLRCSVAVFLGWALVVSSAMAFMIVHMALARRMPLDLDIYEDWYLRRHDWQAQPACTRDYLDLPLEYVIIGHSASRYCTEKYNCIKRVLEIQEEHNRRGWGDIGPNFLVSGNAMVFEGRGADVFPAMVLSWNRRSVMIMFIGDYSSDDTNDDQFVHVNLLLQELVKKQVLVPDYKVLAMCQAVPYTVGPGSNIMARMDLLPHWDSTNKSLCIDMP